MIIVILMMNYVVKGWCNLSGPVDVSDHMLFTGRGVSSLPYKVQMQNGCTCGVGVFCGLFSCKMCVAEFEKKKVRNRVNHGQWREATCLSKMECSCFFLAVGKRECVKEAVAWYPRKECSLQWQNLRICSVVSTKVISMVVGKRKSAWCNEE